MPRYPHYYRLEGRTPVPVGVFELDQAISDIANRTVRKDEVDGVEVSTVFLGIDHQWKPEGPPILFETMIFGGDLDGYQVRYSTWDEAESGHMAALLLVRGERSDVKEGEVKLDTPPPEVRTRLDRIADDE